MFAAVKNQVRLLLDSNALLMKAAELPKDVHVINVLDDQISSLDKEIRHYADLQEKVYVDFKEDIIEKDDYEELKARFISKQEQAEKSRALVTEKKRKVMEEPILPLEWLEEIRNIGSVDKITRKLVAMLVEKIIVYDKDNIEIVFRYGDEINYILNLNSPRLMLPAPAEEVAV